MSTKWEIDACNRRKPCVFCVNIAKIMTKRRKTAFLSPNIFIFGFFFVLLHANLWACVNECERMRIWIEKNEAEKYKNRIMVCGTEAVSY